MSDPTKLTHFDNHGHVHMVDVGEKAITKRIAIAEGWITMQPATLEMIAKGNHKKGDVLSVARVAAIMATKKTADLIPLCHPIPLTKVNVDMQIEIDNNAVRCEVTAETTDRTGIEMEALTGLNIALLTIYDMCKAVDRGMQLKDIRLLHKSGGKTGEWNRGDA